MFKILIQPTYIGMSKESDDIKQTRRRLSVMSDNKLVEGFDSVNLDAGEEEVCSTNVSHTSCF